MTTDTHAPTSHAESIFLAVLLFLLGEKSLVLSKLGLVAFDGIVKNRPPGDPFVYEISLVGLAVGTCAVILISTLRQRTLKKDNLAILIGLITATIAALLNIADAALFGEVDSVGDIPQRAFFFYTLWIILLILPLFDGLLKKDGQGDINLSNLVLTATVFIVALIAGQIFRPVAGAIILHGLQIEGATSLNGAHDKLRFNSDTLIVLGSVWTVSAFAPFAGASARIWRWTYVLTAPIAGYFYAYVISFPGGDPSHGVSAERMALGFAALSLAAIAPGMLYFRGILEGQWKVAFKCAFLTFAFCAFAMFHGLSNTQSLLTYERLSLSLLQGLAGAFVPLSVSAGVRILAWLRSRNVDASRDK